VYGRGHWRRVNLQPAILFLEQQSWRGGAQRVLQEVLRVLEPDFLPIVAFPEDGAFAAEMRKLGFETLFYPLGRYHSGAKPLADMAAFPYHSIRSALYLAEVIRRRRAKLIYINGPRCLWAGALAGHLTGVPTLFHLHTTLMRRVDRLVAVLGTRLVTKVIACSRSAATGLGQTGSRRELEVICNPTRTWPAAPGLILPGSHAKAAEANPGGDNHGPIVGVVGRITPSKGQHVAIEAVGKLVLRGLHPLLVFVGATDPHSRADEEYLASLRQNADVLGVTANVWWAGYQDNPGPFYKIFDAVLIPTTTCEGLPMVALEAMHCGVPVIGSDVCGITEIIRHGRNGYLVPAGDDGALAARLEQVLADPELRARLSAGALATVGATGQATKIGDALESDRFSIRGFERAIRRVVAELCPLPPPGDNPFGRKAPILQDQRNIIIERDDPRPRREA
jgi:glycosyltransferase involved in cell wall biosynthesis